jgi:tRNA threonylcarbamoyl adenosine modification protein YjeE
MTVERSWHAQEADYPRICREIREDLLSDHPFVLWLLGDLGAGKTTFAGTLLHELGLDQEIPVLSPTFTYLTEYETPLGRIGHADLYRLVNGDTDSVEALLSGRDFRGLIIEWPERAKETDQIAPTKIITFSSDSDMEHRKLAYGRR